MKKFVGGVIGFLVGASIAFIVVAALVPRHGPYDVDAGYWALAYYIFLGLPAGGLIGAVVGVAIGARAGKVMAVLSLLLGIAYGLLSIVLLLQLCLVMSYDGGLGLIPLLLILSIIIAIFGFVAAKLLWQSAKKAERMR